MENVAIIQVGFKALRTPSGEFKAAMPIYLPETPKLAAREKAIISDAEQDLALLIARYIDTQDKLKAQIEAEPTRTQKWICRGERSNKK